MTQVAIGVGSNYKRNQNIAAALDKLYERWGELLVSPVYESLGEPSAERLNKASAERLKKTSAELSKKPLSEQEACINPSLYYNLVVILHTDMDVVALKKLLREIECELDRRRDTRDVTIDLDILLIDDWIGAIEESTIPHPDIESCPYVLRPLADLLPNVQHPVLKKTFNDLWSDNHSEKTLTPVDFVWRDKVLSVSACIPII